MKGNYFHPKENWKLYDNDANNSSGRTAKDILEIERNYVGKVLAKLHANELCHLKNNT